MTRLYKMCLLAAARVRNILIIKWQGCKNSMFHTFSLLAWCDTHWDHNMNESGSSDGVMDAVSSFVQRRPILCAAIALAILWGVEDSWRNLLSSM